MASAVIDVGRQRVSAGQGALPDVAARLERLPMTGYQRRVFAVIATAWLVDQVDVALLTFLLGSLIAAFKLSPTQAGTLAAMTYLGQLVGNVLAGAASDRFGRRPVFQGTMILWGASSLLAAVSWSIGSLMLFRFLIGVGVGGEAPVAQAMVAELVPARVRGRYIAFMEGFWAVGYVLSGCICYFLLPLLGWRAAFAAVGALAAIVLLVRRALPESPRWLAERGRVAEAEQAVSMMEAEVYGQLGGEPPGADPVEALPEFRGAISGAADASPKLSAFATVFSRAYARRTAMAFGLWFFALIGFFGLNSWIAVLLKAHGFTLTGSVGFVTLITTGGIPGFFTAALLLERVGRKPTTAAFLLLSAVAAYAYGHASGTAALFAAGFTMQFFLFGMWSCLYAYTPELYPTRARSTGAGMASAAGRVGAILGPILVPMIVARGGQGAAFTLGAGAFALAALLVATLGVETRGKVLEAVSR